MDDKGALQSVGSVEVNLPWNNTSITPPLLPDVEHGSRRMDDGRILYLPEPGGGYNLYLLGGTTGAPSSLEYGDYSGTRAPSPIPGHLRVAGLSF